MSAAANPLAAEIRHLLKSPAQIVMTVPGPSSKPFGPYADHAACVAANQDADDPNAYCASIEAAIAGKETPWLDVKPWKEWKQDGPGIFETFIGSQDVVDLQKERVPNEDYVSNLPFLVKFGYYEWIHTGQKIGEPIAWRYEVNPKTGRPAPKIRVGLIDPDDPVVPPTMKGELRGAWVAIREMAAKGQSSINGMWAKREECDGAVCWKVTDQMALWAVGWVANRAANPVADVSLLKRKAAELPPDVAKIALELIEALTGAKQSPGQAPQDPATVCGQLWMHGSDTQREAFGDGSGGAGPDVKPPAPWWDDCTSMVGKMAPADLNTFVRAYPKGFRYKAEALIENGCPPCRQRYDSMIRAGFGHEKAVAAVQEVLDETTGWKRSGDKTLKSTPQSEPNKGRSMSDEDDAKAKKAAEDAAKAAAAAAAGTGTDAGKEQPDYIAQAAIQELAKRIEALELAAQNTTPKMVEAAIAPIKEQVSKILAEEIKGLRTKQTNYETRLGALESFAGRATLGLASKQFYSPPPRDTGPKQGVTRKRLVEIAAGSKSQSELLRKMREAANQGGD